MIGDCVQDCHTSRHRGCVTQDHPGQVMMTSSAAVASTSVPSVRSDGGTTADCAQLSSYSGPLHAGRQPSYLRAVYGRDDFAQAAPPPSRYPPSSYSERTGGMYSISENEDCRQQSGSGAAISQQRRSAETAMTMMENRSRTGKKCLETRHDGRAMLSDRQADLMKWCLDSTGGDVGDGSTYIRSDDVRKILELRRHKTGTAVAAAAPCQSCTQVNPNSSCRLEKGSAGSNRVGSSGLRHSSAANWKGSGGHEGSGVGSNRYCSAVYQPELYRSRPIQDYGVDSASIGSYKDSGYRSEEEHHSGECSSDSPTLSASNSAVSLANCSNAAGVDRELETKHPEDARSLCSSFESLSSIHSIQSLPAAVETRLRAIPESLHPQGSSSSTRLRQKTEDFTRPARGVAVCGYRQPVKADHGAVLNPKYPAGYSSTQQDGESTNQPDSRRPTWQFACPPVGGDGCVRHAGSVPAVNRLNGSSSASGLSEDRHPCRRPATGRERHYSGSAMAPSSGQSGHGHREIDQQPGSAGARRVQGRGHFRETGAVIPSLRQTPTSKPADYSHLIRHSALMIDKPPWK